MQRRCSSTFIFRRALHLSCPCLLAAAALAQTPVTLTTWDLTDAPGNQAATPATADAAHVHGLPLTRGAGVTPAAYSRELPSGETSRTGGGRSAIVRRSTVI